MATGCVSADAIATGAVTVADIPDGEITHVKLAADCVDGENIVDDSINSEHYVDGSIDHAHLSDDCVDGDNIAADVALTGNPTTTTQSAGNNTTRIATTAFVTTAIDAIDQDAIVTPQAAQNNRTFSTGNNHLMAGPVTIASGQVFTLDSTAKLTIIG